MRTSSLTPKAACCTPRRGTLAVVPVLRFGRSTITNSSADARGPSRPRSIPGPPEMIRTSSRESTLYISAFDPPRSTIARSSAPVVVMTARNPDAIERTATNTATTPATPKPAASEAPLRSLRVRRFSRLTTPA
jgi:hypothetical protein